MVVLLPLNRLKVESFPTGNMTAQEFNKLKHSIQTHGVLYPIKVVPDGDYYKVIDGRHRLKAAKELNMELIPCLLVEDVPEQVVANTYDVEIYRKNHPDDVTELEKKKEIELEKLKEQVIAKLANTTISKEVLRELAGNIHIKDQKSFDRFVNTLAEKVNKISTEKIRTLEEERDNLIKEREQLLSQLEKLSEQNRELMEQNKVKLSNLKEKLEEEINNRVEAEVQKRIKLLKLTDEKQSEAQINKLRAEIEKQIRREVEKAYKDEIDKLEAELEEQRALAQKFSKETDNLRRQIENLKQQLSVTESFQNQIKALEKELEQRQAFITSIVSLDKASKELDIIAKQVETFLETFPILISIINNTDRVNLYNRCCSIQKSFARCCDILKP